MAKKSRYLGYVRGVQRTKEKRKKIPTKKSVLSKLKGFKNGGE